jgi:phage terminase small subunit
MAAKKVRKPARKPKAGAIEHLSEEARRLYEETVEDYDISHEAGLSLILRAAEALDRMRKAQAILKRQGLITNDARGGTRPHPAIAIETEAHRQYLGALRMLSLRLDPEANS